MLNSHNSQIARMVVLRRKTTRFLLFLSLFLQHDAPFVYSLVTPSRCRPFSSLEQPQPPRKAHLASAKTSTEESSSSTTTTTTDAYTRRQQSRSVGRDPLLSLNLNLDALARSDAPEQAQELFHRITALHAAGYYDVQPDTVSFNSVLKAWKASPEKALEFWESTTATPGSSSSSTTITKNIRSYNAFCLALASVGMYEAATQLLTQMQWINAAVRPDRITYNLVLLAHTRAAPPRAALADQAEALLQQMLEGITTTTSSQQPSSSSSSGTTSSSKTKFRMVQIPPVIDPNYVPPRPDATTFNSVIACIQHHCGSADPVAAAHRAEGWLRYMAQNEHEDDDVPAPDAYTYTAVLKAWYSAGRRNPDLAVEHALQLLDEAMQHHVLRRDSHEHVIVVTLVVQILCGAQQPSRAEQLLLESLSQPDVTAYTTLMQGWVNHYYSTTSRDNQDPSHHATNVAALQAAVRIWKHMQAAGVAPSAHTFTILLKAASRVDVAWAERILHYIPQQEQQLSVIHYNTVLDGYARRGNAVAAERLWDAMRIAPDIVTYNSVLRAAATHVRIGDRVWAALRDDESVSPTPATFQATFKWIWRSRHPDRWERLQETIRWCSEGDGWNRRVVQQLRRCQLTEPEQAAVREWLPDDELWDETTTTA